MIKRAFDLLLVCATLPLWLLLLAFTWLAIKLTQGGEVFFVQQRAGLSGQPFRIIKFRTMNDDRDSSGQLMDDEHRITRLGSLLRKTSLDEVPQLINVLNGTMSLVGPRPLLMDYLPLYSPEHARRHEVRPGITGLAQISGRNLLSWDDRLDLDVRYVDEQCLWLDLRILIGTVVNVLRRRGVSSAESVTMHRYRGPGS